MFFGGGGGCGRAGSGTALTYLTTVVGCAPHVPQNGSSVKKNHGDRKMHRMKNMPKSVIHVASHSSADGVVCGDGVVPFALMPRFHTHCA